MGSSVCIQTAREYREESLAAIIRNALVGVAPDIMEWLNDADPARLVVVKPNWIQEAHGRRPDVWEPVITHPALLLALVGVLAESMRGQGTLCLCDAPHTYASFEKIVARGRLSTRLDVLRRRWPQMRFEIIDLRREVWICKDDVVVERHPNPPDPRGYAKLDLGSGSLFYRHRGEGRYYGADYDSHIVNAHHHGTTHEYLIAGTPLRADLFINVPKLKTHKKTGLTCCLKNLVGINGDKNWLPHHTEGPPSRGGDEYPDERRSGGVESSIKRIGRRAALGVPGLGPWAYRKMRNVGRRILGDSDATVRNGNWNGNDTCWRMALDLNRALLYGNPDGTWREAGTPRRYLAVVDGVIGGEGNGPLCPDPVASGVVICGRNPAFIDAVACRLMGFDPHNIPIVANAFLDHQWPISSESLDDVCVDDSRVNRTLPLRELSPAVPGGFRPHFGWPETVIR